MRLKEYLKVNDLTYADFASRLGVTEGAVRYWASGERLPNRAAMAKIVKATNGDVMPNDFYGRPEVA